MFGTILTLAILLFVASLFIKNIKIIQQAEVMLIERFGKYNRTLMPGNIHFIIPFVEMPRGIFTKVSYRSPDGSVYNGTTLSERIDMRESVFDFPRQNVITKDNVSIGINALIYYQIVDPVSAVYEIQNLPEAIEKLTQTTLRNIIGELDLDETLVSRDTINSKLRVILDAASEKWGVKVNRVELQDIIPPADIQAAMEKQMKAERERRAVILEAEGKKKAAILEAEGMKEAAINKAEGQKKAAILVAEGNAEARVRQAEGEAQAITNIVTAIKGNGEPDKYLIATRYIDTLKYMVEGKDNKVIYMPYEATGILSSIDGIREMFGNKA